MKFLAVLSSIISLFIFSPVSAQNTTYALIQPECVLYLDENATTSLFSLPETYFVQILETNEDVYKVSYLDKVGYIKAESATIVDYVPLYKYPSSLTCHLSNDGNTVTLRSSPFIKSDNVITRLSENEEVEYYGARQGDIQIEQLGNTWYYVKDGNGNYGYVYNLYLTPPTIAQNDYSAFLQGESSSISSSLSLNSLQGGIVIALLSLLFIVLLLLCLRPKAQRD